MQKLTYPRMETASEAVSVFSFRLFSTILLALLITIGQVNAQGVSSENAFVRTSPDAEFDAGVKGVLKGTDPGAGGGQIGVLAVGPNADTVSTVPPFVANNGQAGVTLEFIANQPVDITGFGAVFNTGITSADLWMRTGGVNGPPTIDAANGWTKVITGAPVTGANTADVAYMDFGTTKISLPANTRVGFYVNIPVGTSGIRYLTGSAGDQLIHTDGVATVDVSDYASYGGQINPTFNPRRFCGAVVYELAVTGNCTPFTNFAINNVTGTSADVSWTPGSGNTSFYMEYGPSGFTPGTGTSITGTHPGAQPPVLLTGLSPQTTYDIYFGEICNSGADTAKFPSPQSFTTTRLCPPPTAFMASNITSNSVDLSWNHAGGAPAFNIIHGPSGFDPATSGTTTAALSSPTTLTGLSPVTSYDIYLAAACGIPNGNSDTVGPISIMTLIQGPTPLNCTSGNPSVVFTEEFDAVNGWTGDLGSSGGDWEIPGAPGSSGTGPNNEHSGAAGGFANYEASGAGSQTGFLYSPLIDLTQGSNDAELSFWMHAYGADMGTLVVGVSTSLAGPFDTVFTWSGQLQTSGADPWANVGADLSAYLGQSIYLMFAHTHSGVGFTGDMSIDLVEVSTCLSCAIPGNQSNSNLTSSSTDLAWVENGTATSWQVSYGPSGFTPGTGTQAIVTNMSYSATGLAPNTTYDWYVRAICGKGDTSGWAGAHSFTTLCAAISTPYFQDFETGFTAGNFGPNINACFNSINTVQSRWEVEDATGGNENSTGTGPFYDRTNFGTVGGHYLYLETSGSANTSDTLTSDQIDVSGLTTPYFGFSYHMYGATMGSLEVEVWDGANWVNITTITGQVQTAGGDPWTDFAANLPTLSTNVIQLRFIGIRGTSLTSDMAIDDVFVTEAPACVPSSALMAVNITSTSADLSWTSGGGTTFNVEYGPAGFTPGSGTLVSGVSNPYSVSGLMGNTTYDFYVQDDCGTSGTSSFVGPGVFTTLCAPATAPYSQDFETGFAPGSFGPAINPCFNATNTSTSRWEVEDATGANENSSNTGPFYDNTNFGTAGGHYIFLETSGTTNTSDTLTSDEIDVSSLTNPFLKFSYHMYGADMGTLEVEVWDGTAWVNITSITGPQQSAGSDPWLEFGGALPTLTGSITRIRFIGIRGTGFASDMSIDDLMVIEAPACVNSTGLTASNVTGTSADLSWTPGGGSSFNLEYGPAGFAPGSGTVITGASNPQNITGLSPLTAYDFYVEDDCGGSTALAGPATFNTQLQGPLGVSCSAGNPGFVFSDEFDDPNIWSGDIAGSGNGVWRFNSGGTGSSGTGPSGPHSGSNYIYFEGSTGGLDTASIFTGPIDLTCATGAAELSFWMHAYGAGMGALDVRVATAPGGPYTDVFNYPGGTLQTGNADPYQQVGVDLTSYLGQVIYLEFRIRRLGTAFTTDMAIDLVQVETCISCPLPSSLMVSNVGTTTADISWQGGSSTAWEVEYGPAGFAQGAGTILNVNSSSTTLTGLMPGTAYEYYVRTNCGFGSYSCWVGPVAFATDLCDSIDKCEFYFDLEDGFGDGWNGALVTVYQNGIPVAVLGGSFNTGTNFGPDTVLLCDSVPSMIVLTNAGSFPSEVGISVRNSLGVPMGYYPPTSGSGQGDTLVLFNSYCTFCPEDSVYQQAQICQGDSMMVGGAWQNTSGLYLDMYTNRFGCDSLVYTDLFVIPTIFVNKQDSICEGDSTMIGGSWVYTPGVYTEIYQASNGCDSVCIIDLMVMMIDSVPKSIEICDGDSVWINGIYEKTSGTYYESYTLSNGCDSVCVINLLVKPHIYFTADASICDGDSIFLGGAWQKISGSYVDVYPASNGCDSIVTTVLTVFPTYNLSASDTICAGDSALINGSYETMAGIYSKTYSTIYNCDSTFTVTLVVKPTSTVQKTDSICQGDSVMIAGMYRSMAGVYCDTLTASNGCDSICCTTLSILPSYSTTSTDDICDGDSIFLGGAWQTTAGNYCDTLTASNGCDSIHCVLLSVLNGSVVYTNDSICDGDSIYLAGAWRFTSGIYCDSITSPNGCMGVFCTDLTVLPTDSVYKTDSICANDSIWLSGMWVNQPGMYYDTLTNMYGCDSICCTNLTILPVDMVNKADSICYGDSLWIGGSWRTMSGIYYDTLTNMYGCDSICITNLSVLPWPKDTVMASMCPGDSMYLGGAWRTMAGLYIDTVSNPAGCDSIICTDLSLDSTGCTYDCNGDLNGTAYYDACGTCVGGNTGLLPCVPGCTPNEVKSISLIDASNAMVVKALVDGDTIDKGVWPMFSVRADTCGTPFGSIVFSVNGVPFSRENLWPYAIKGGNATNYHAWDPIPGTYVVTATPYSMSNGNGTMGTAYSVTVHIKGVPPTVDCNGDLGGSAYLDSCGVCVGGTTGKTPCATGCSSLEVISFDLVSTASGHAMKPLNDGDTIYLGSISSFTIRANTCDVSVGSVLFDLNGSFFKKENQFPYDIMGGSFSSPIAFMPPLGTHTVVATPYAGKNGKGMAGIAETVTFHVVAGVAPRSGDPNNGNPDGVANREGSIGHNGNIIGINMVLKVFPNPTEGVTTISLENANTDQPVIISDVSGKVIATLYPSNVEDGLQIYNLDMSSAPKGIYLIRVGTGEEILTKRLIVN